MLIEFWSDLRYRLRALFRRTAVERELDAELKAHVERAAEKYEHSGMSAGEALRRARLEFGGFDRAKEEARDARGTASIDTFVQDVRYAARSLRGQPSFTLSVVLILGIGIGANSAVFTLFDALLLRPLPVSHPEQLVTVGDPAAVHSSWTGSPEIDYVSYPVFADIRDQNTVFSGVYANGTTDDWDVAIDAGNPADVEHPLGRLVSGEFFSVLRVPAYLGRTFSAREDVAPGHDPVAVISYSYWLRRFQGERAVIGRVIHVNRAPITIIGVTPPTFTGDIVGETTDIWLPMMMAPVVRPDRRLINNREASWLAIMGRLAPGVTIEQARSQISALETQSIRAHISGRTLREFEDDLKARPIRVEAGTVGFSSVRDFYGSAILITMAAVGLVVLVVCANVCNLMLTRAAARGREMTVRLALGAGRGRLVRQLLTESAVLAALAGGVALIVARAGSRVLLSTATLGERPIALDTRPDSAIFAFTAATTLTCLMLFGLAPALGATRVDVAAALRAHGRNLFGARHGRVRVGPTLVLAQMALSTLLLLGSGLLVRSMQRLLHVDLGLDRDHIVMVHVAASRTGYVGARLAALRRDMVARVRQLPGVDAASYSVEGLFSGGQSAGHVEVPGFIAQADSEREIRYDEVGPDYFRALGAHIVRGRDFDAHDVDDSTNAGAINETMARWYFPGRDPIGRRVVLDSVAYTIAAVVPDVQEGRNLRAKPVRRLYFATFAPSDQPQSFELEVHVTGNPARLVEPLRRAVASVDGTVPLDVAPLSDRVRRSAGEEVLLTKVTLFFGILALVLAALGLYGVTAYSTARRTAEFGLRTALGATPGGLTRMVVGEAARLTLVGVAIGIPLGLAATRLIRRQIFGVGAVDPPSLSAAIFVLVVASLIASWLPARRAAGVSPLEALRTE
jgi:predicted permease